MQILDFKCFVVYRRKTSPSHYDLMKQYKIKTLSSQLNNDKIGKEQELIKEDQREKLNVRDLTQDYKKYIDPVRRPRGCQARTQL